MAAAAEPARSFPGHRPEFEPIRPAEDETLLGSPPVARMARRPAPRRRKKRPYLQTTPRLASSDASSAADARTHREGYVSQLHELVQRPRTGAVQFLEALIVESKSDDGGSASDPDVSDASGEEMPSSGRLWRLVPVSGTDSTRDFSSEVGDAKAEPTTGAVPAPDGGIPAENKASGEAAAAASYVMDQGEKINFPREKGLESGFGELSHVHVCHRQGLSSPPLVFKVLSDPGALVAGRAASAKKRGSAGARTRPVYMLMLPQVAADQTENCLCCRRKAKGNKFRFSLDETRITKKNNPKYIGKMKQTSEGVYEVYLARDNLHVMQITIRDREVSVEIVTQFLNTVERGRGGRTIRGLIQNFVQPMLTLNVESSKRSVLKVSRPYEIKDVARSTTQQHTDAKYEKIGSRGVTKMPAATNRDGTYLVDYDYPLTIFLSFSIVCALKDAESRAAKAGTAA